MKSMHRWPARVIPSVLLLCGLALGVAWPGVSHGSDASEAPEASRLPPAMTDDETPDVDRGNLLSDLYGQLGTAKDKESAALVADAIEKLWLASGSDTVDLLMGRALKLVEAADHDIALKILDAVVEIAPDYSEGWNQRATVYYLKRDYQGSLNDLRQVLALDPHHFKAINGLALILQELGDKKGALKAFRQALKVHPFLGGAKQSESELKRDVEGQGI